ncbi:hypothetical protein JCM8208_000376 [Rhodotorula glutinis]
MPRLKRAAAAKQDTYAAAASNPGDGDDRGPEATNRDASSKSSSTPKGSVHEDDEHETWTCDGESDHAPAAKKARTSASSTKSKSKDNPTTKGMGRRKSGKLSAFLAMPLDILVEICRHLGPPSLLSMSRANKLMHNLFARRSAAPIWAAVRRNVNMPDLEATDLTEMQLASLIYERNCLLCGRGRAVIVDYSLRIRWCKNCQDKNLTPWCGVRNRIHDLHSNTRTCSFVTLRSADASSSDLDKLYCLADVHAVNNRLHDLDLDVMTLATQRHTTSIKSSDRDTELVQQTTAPDGPVFNRLEAFVVKPSALVHSAHKDGRELAQWETALKTARQDANDAGRRARRSAIVDKLVDMGYSRVDCAFENCDSTVARHIGKTFPLCDKEWTRISPSIIKDVEGAQSDRLALACLKRMEVHHARLEPAYDAILTMYVTNEDDYATCPSLYVFSTLPSVEPFWVPEGAPWSDDEWAAALPAVLDELNRTRRAVKIGYARHVVEGLVAAGAPVDAALVKKLDKPAEPICLTAALLGAVSLDRPPRRIPAHLQVLLYKYKKFADSKVDLGDVAESVSSAELDGVLSTLVAKFSHVGTKPGADLHPYPDILLYEREHRRSGLAGPRMLPQTALIEQQLDVLERVGLPNHRSSEAKLEALGPVFECHGCPQARVYYVRMVGPREPDVELSWSQMIKHACGRHGRDYAPSDDVRLVDRMPQIRLSTSTYPPDSPAAAVAATTSSDSVET